MQFRLTSAYGEQLLANVSVPTDSWVQQKEWVAFPPISTGAQFKVSHNPPSKEANEHYKHCLPKAKTALVEAA